MVLPIAAGALGGTFFTLLAAGVVIHLLSKEEVGIMTIAAVVIAYLYFTSKR